VFSVVEGVMNNHNRTHTQINRINRLLPIIHLLGGRFNST
jgi:hypothetical protein